MKLQEVCSYVADKIDNSALNIENYISTENMMQNCGGITSASNVPVGKSTRFIEGDILFSNIRPYFKKLWRANISGGCSADVLCIRANEKIDPTYLYYLLTQDSFISYVMAGTKGCKMPRGDKQYNMAWNINLPSLDVQVKIAAQLSEIDDKIAVNRRICENLEAQAQALFKHWFIDFAPFKNGKFVESELGMIPLSEVCEQITDGVHNSVKDEPNSNYMLLSCKNIVGGVLSKNNYRSISKSTFESLRMRTKLAKGDVLLSSVGTIGEIAIVEEDPINYEFQRSVAIIKPKNNIGTYFLYNALLASKVRLQHAAHGAVQQCLFIGDLKKFEVICCDTENASRYNEIVRPLFEEIAKLHQESTRLSTLRDTLLPKLMSGQIKV